MATQQDVIKKFMASLDKTTLNGTAALDEAIQACSNFNSLQEVIDQMVSDCRTVNNAKNFLLNYCGINLDNDDTGAITGFDAGGSVVKDAEDIVPETGELINFTGNSFTVNGLTLQLEENFNNLTDSQKFIWQGLYTWWAKGALDLIAESYGNNFGFDSNSSATTNTMYVNFAEKRSNVLASMSYKYDNLYLSINNIQYGYYLDSTNINGKNTFPPGFWISGITDLYLDRTLAHEFTHAIMMANIGTWNFPKFITEGMAELTHGIDDERKNLISNLASNTALLASALNLNEVSDSTVNENAYAGGYMFLRYLAKQSADEDNVIANNQSAMILNGTNSNDNIFNNGDSVSIYAGAGKDIIDNRSDYSYINASAGDNYIYTKGYKVTIYAGTANDTILARISHDNQVFAGDGNDLIISDYVNGLYGTIDGGTGNDTLISVGGAVFGGEGNDLIISSSGTINGGAGNDTIDGRNIDKWGRLYQYAQGDGADIIIGFNSFDTLEITSGTYSTTKSGNNLFVNVGNGSITLKDIYVNENTKIHIKDAAGNVVTLNDWSIMSGTSGADSLYNVCNNITVSGLGGNDTIENYGNKVSISGGVGNDSIYNFVWDDGNVTIDGGIGNDTITSEGYEITINGGEGNDYIDAGEEDVIYGGTGNDTIIGSYSTIYGDAGNDSITSHKGSSNTVDGGDGNDTITSFDGASLMGGVGDDIVSLRMAWYEGTATIAGGIGNDTMYYGNLASDFMAAMHYGVNSYRAIYQYSNGDGNDVINGFSKYDAISITGGSYSTIVSGNDIIVRVGNGSITLKDAKNIEELNIDGTFDSTGGGDTVKTITNTKSDTLINGTSGNDTIISAKYEGAEVLYRNTINGGAGNDNIRVYLSSLNAVYGDSGNDSIYADYNDDITISGGDGNDSINAVADNRALILGGAGNDKITVQGQGNQTINGGKGNDTIYGSSSNRLYQYASGDGNDIIYNISTNDTLQITGAKYSTVKSGKDLKISVGSGSILLKDAANISVNIVGTLDGGGTSNETLPAGISIKSSVLTASTKFAGNKINLSDYPTATKVNAAALSKGVSIVGTAAANSLKGGKGADTISGGSGNDTLTGGAGADIFIYSGGNDLITDYKPGEDKISISYTSSSVKGSDVVLTTSNGNLTIKGTKDKVVSFVDGEDKIFYSNISYTPLATGLKYDAKRTTLTVDTKFTGSQIDLQNYLSTVTKVNASALKKAVEITGNDSANSIKGGNGADTISGGSGNDTLTGGKGNDVFIYSGGNDLITDYKPGEDRIKISYTSSSVKGSDVVLTTSNGNLTIKGAKDKIISFVDGEDKIFYSNISYSPLATGLKYDAKRTTLTVDTKFTGSQIDLQNYLSTVTKINASALKKAVEITGNDSANSIKGGNGADTISGGSGNDTLTGGKGNDVFIYSSGKDVITDYAAGDSIQIESGRISKTTYSGKNVIFTIGSGTLTVKNGKGKNISVTDSSGTKTYSKTLDLFEDNNFISDSAQLSDITEKKFEVTQVQTPNYSALVQNNQTFLTYGKAKQ